MGWCGVADNLEGVDGGRYLQWARGHVITWDVERGVTGFSREDVASVVEAAWALWSAVADVRSQRVTSGSPNVLITSRRLDGQNGVLAQAQLPSQNQRSGTLGLWLDTSEVWVLAKNPPPGKMDILRVIAHELGHSLGLGHAPGGSPNLMAPAVSRIREPQAGWDIPQIVARLGLPGATQPPAGGDDPLTDLIRAILEACPREAVAEATRTARDVLIAWGERS